MNKDEARSILACMTDADRATRRLNAVQSCDPRGILALDLQAIDWTMPVMPDSDGEASTDATVAVINVCGVLCADASELWWMQATGYNDIRAQIEEAVTDPNITAIALCIDSPGGSVDLVFETADAIHEACKQKPISAIVHPMACSAAYLLASACDRVYVPPTSGRVGSIGIIATHFDYSGALAKAGVAVTMISSGARKTDGNPYEPLSDSARASLEAESTRLYSEFVGRVAEWRGLSPDAIRAMGADCQNGAAQAIESGLADESADFDTAIESIAKRSASTSSGMAASAMTSTKGGATMPATPIPTADAQAAAVNIEQITADARDSGYSAAAEIIDLCAIAGRPTSEAAAFVKEKKSASDVRAHLLALKVKADAEEIDSAVKPAEAKGDEIPVNAMSDIVKQLQKGRAK